MKVLTVVGARPQFIKAAAVSRELRRNHEEVLIHTGQHYDEEMSDVFFEELGMPEPDHNLGVGSNSHGVQTAEMLVGLEEQIADEEPDVVLVYGDEESHIEYSTFVPQLSALLARGFGWRLQRKYLLRDFHPLAFLYGLGVLGTLGGIYATLRGRLSGGGDETVERAAAVDEFRPAVVVGERVGNGKRARSRIRAPGRARTHAPAVGPRGVVAVGPLVPCRL